MYTEYRVSFKDFENVYSEASKGNFKRQLWRIKWKLNFKQFKKFETVKVVSMVLSVLCLLDPIGSLLGLTWSYRASRAL